MNIARFGKPLALVSFDCFVTMLLASLAGFFLLAIGIASGPGDVTTALTSRWIAHELSAASPSDPAVTHLVDRLRTDMGSDPAAYHVTAELRDASVWIVAWFSDPQARQATNAAVSASGLGTGRMMWGVNWGELAAELTLNPVAALQRLAWLTPLFIACGAVAFLIAGLAFRRLRPVAGFETAPPSWREALPRGVAIGVAGLMAAHAAAAVAAVFGLEGSEQAWIVDLAGGDSTAIATLAVLAVGIAPLGEELFFRGHVFRYLAARGDPWLAYGGSAVLFSAAHFNPGATPGYVVAALVMGWSYQRWRSLRIPMIAHAAWNAVGVALLLVS